MMPDKNNKISNIVESNNSIENIRKSPVTYLNPLIGKFVNRIKEGKFTLENKEYQLTINNPPNSLHRGPKGFHTKVWEVEKYLDKFVQLKFVSKDSEEGYPDELTVKVEYS